MSRSSTTVTLPRPSCMSDGFSARPYCPTLLRSHHTLWFFHWKTTWAWTSRPRWLHYFVIFLEVWFGRFLKCWTGWWVVIPFLSPLADLLYTNGAVEDLTQLPSPHELRHKIIIKGKKIDSGKEAAKSPAKSPASCSSSESEFLSTTSQYTAMESPRNKSDDWRSIIQLTNMMPDMNGDTVSCVAKNQFNSQAQDWRAIIEETNLRISRDEEVPVAAACNASTVSVPLSNSGDSFLSGIELTKVTDVLETSASDSSFHSSVQAENAKRPTSLELRKCATVAMRVHSTVKEEQETCITGSLNGGMSCCSSHEVLEGFHQQDCAQYSLDSDKLSCISSQAADSSPQNLSPARDASSGQTGNPTCSSTSDDEAGDTTMRQQPSKNSKNKTTSICPQLSDLVNICQAVKFPNLQQPSQESMHKFSTAVYCEQNFASNWTVKHWGCISLQEDVITYHLYRKSKLPNY